MAPDLCGLGASAHIAWTLFAARWVTSAGLWGSQSRDHMVRITIWRSAVASKRLKKRLQSSTENKTILLGGSRKLYVSARKVIELWIETKAVISWVTPTTAFLMRQLIIVSRLGRTRIEYQILLMEISWWDRNVKIKC